MVGSARAARGERHQLAFAARQARPALAHFGVEPHRERSETFGDAERGDRGVDLFVGRVRSTDPHVVAHGAGEQEAFLRHDDDPLPERVHRRVPEVDAAHLHRTAPRVVEAHDQLRQRRLPGPGGTDERQPLPGAMTRLTPCSTSRPEP